jgi:hypothetical protein
MKLAELLDRIGPVGRVVGAKPRESVFEQHKKHLRERLWVGMDGLHVASWLVRHCWRVSTLGILYTLWMDHAL